MTQLVKPIILPVTLEAYAHRLVNEERRRSGLPALAYDRDLAAIARHHSADMAARRYFKHETPEGAGPTQRAQRCGHPAQRRVSNTIYSGIPENIARIPLCASSQQITHFIEHPGGRRITGTETINSWNCQEELAVLAVNGWMNSPGAQAEYTLA